MDAYINAPFAHNRTSHLTKLYSDVKQSAVTSLDVKSFLNQQQATEQFGALHRRFRIQKDRLVTWGLEWDDEGKGAETSIDETVERAGLTETVTSVLANVKEVTDELEHVRTGVSKPGEKYQPTIFDEERYGGLLGDLTASIDTLYDLSRTRRALVRGEHPMLSATSQTATIQAQSTTMSKRQSKAPSLSNSESESTLVQSAPRPVNSPFVGLPPRMEPSAFRMPAESPPPYEPPGVPMASRLIAHMISSRVPEEVRSAMGSDNAEVPVLIEYADFDQAYRQTGVPPPLQRMEDLSKALPPMRPESQSNLSLLGYFEDPRQPRIGLVYDLPYSVQNRILSNPARRAETLAPLNLLKMLRKQDRTTANAGQMDAPPLEARFKLALRLTEQLYMLHLQELPHGNINSSSVLFATATNESSFTRMKQLRAPMWASFNIFPSSLGGPIRSGSTLNIYKHPQEDEKTTRNDAATGMKYDMYAFALLLVEIGLWTPLGDFYKTKYKLADFKLRIEKLWIPKLAERCGSAYMRAVQACIKNVDSGELTTEGIFGYIFDNLRKCCALDEDTEELIPASPFTASQADYQPFVQTSSNVVTTGPEHTRSAALPAPGAELDPTLLSPAPTLKDFKRRVTQIQRQWRRYRSWLREIQTIPSDEEIARKLSEMENAPVEEPAPARPQSNLSEFPFLEIPKAIMEDWNNGTAVELSRIVNRALKGTRESCSITLTSFGETIETARPTYLITCASTKIVKAMLKRHFRCDPTSCYVRVEKGKISRCRKARPISAARAASRSMAPRYEQDFDAVNPDYQPQPVCGASIGAYKDEEHLPPVSFGGIVTIDGKSYGMSVHHMLENGDMEEQDDDEDDDEGSDTASLVDVSDNAEPLLSDDGSTIRQISVASDISIDEETQLEGDVGGIAPGDGLDIDITQPALDDAILQNLHADESDSDSDSDSGVDEDHILSYKLGQVHASSGLKRTSTKGTEDGYKGISTALPQEIDWALFELLPPRVQPYNVVKGGQQYCDDPSKGQDSIPTAIRTSSQLAGAKVHCLGRTSGLSSGVISSSMDLLKLQGRETFSASWTVHGGFGVGGDSGAWVISSDGKVCGHVLAERAGRTYICPMDLLFDDMRSTLKAKDISLPAPSKNIEGGWFIQGAVSDAVSRLQLSDEGGVAVPFSAIPTPSQCSHGDGSLSISSLRRA